ncbi:MAG: hypothetical protein KAU16_08880 [Methanophagales archaeon]|nr:hypothetical protein [Methanophagales archaeon]
MFKNRIRIVESEKILKDGYWFLDIAGKKPRDSTR